MDSLPRALALAPKSRFSVPWWKPWRSALNFGPSTLPPGVWPDPHGVVQSRPLYSRRRPPEGRRQ